MTNQVFWYVDGEPCKGQWIDMDAIDDTDEVLAILAAAGYCDEDYGGDLLGADAEGLCLPFLGTYGNFGLSEFADCRDADGDEDAKTAYVDHVGTWGRKEFQDAFMGEHDSDEDFIQQFCVDTGWLSDTPEHVKPYIDWAYVARDFMQDFFEQDGFYFRSL